MISAIYISHHKYLKHEPLTLNFGGKYIYSINAISPQKDKFLVTRVSNEKYIENFFSISNSVISLKNLSAIVGQNGVGKSSILDVLRSHFIQNRNALPHAGSFLLIEREEDLFYLSNDSLDLFLEESGHQKKIERNDSKSIQTIYYSPHLDLTFNPNFDEVDYFDISLDKYLDLDLQNLEQRGKNEYGTSYPIKQELLFKNAERQIMFLNSTLVTERKIFDDIFDFPIHGDAILEFRDTNYDEDTRNIPVAFHSPISTVDRKIKEEQDNTGGILSNRKRTAANQLEFDRALFKLGVLKKLLSILIYQMDVNNAYLSEGKWDPAVFNSSEASTAYDLFLSFLNNAFILTPKGQEKAFQPLYLKSLIDKLYGVSDNVSEGRYLGPNKLIVSADDAIEILNLQKEAMFEISNYYNKSYQRNAQDYTGVNYLPQGMIFYSPSERKLSSGENAILNLFSKLFHFQGERANPIFAEKKEIGTYVMLLDEADLGYHPTWKKKFVYAMVKTLPYFFEKYTQKPDLQIIFTTHDPLTLSDLPSPNVIYLTRQAGKIVGPGKIRTIHTFGANITDLLADSFFVEDGLIGDFAKYKIHATIKWLNEPDKQHSELYKKIIELIDEPIVKQKLAEMFDSKMNEDLQLQLIENQIAELEKTKLKLKHDNHTT